ncbi:MAG: biotin/lipoyl-binding protein, partial [Chitinophagales bacterium]
MKLTGIFSLITLIITSCSSKTTMQAETTVPPKTPVEVVTIQNGFIADELTLFGTTIYLRRNSVAASIPAYIAEVNVKLGDKVTRGDILFVLQSKESKALGADFANSDSTFKNFGIIQVTAPATGIITTLDKQQPGDYVLEGTPLCTIAESSDLAFQVNVPYEFTTYTKA